MPDLQDGESVEVQGSSPRPYVLKNVGGVYSCSCPACRHQSLPIERRTCKHLRKLRGDAAETARLCNALPAQPQGPKDPGQAPPLLLAESWDGVTDPAGWWLSETLDGVRAYWDGKQLWSRLGNLFHAPAWFVAGLPATPLDGELWLGRKLFQRTAGIVRRQDQTDLWREVRYLVFDAPRREQGFEARLAFVHEALRAARAPYARAHEHLPCRGLDHLRGELARVEALGGEGLMLRRPGSRYEGGRSTTLLKVKTFHEAEARVLAHQEGSGRHRGRLGALRVETPDGTRFSVGSGLTDDERARPPAVGSLITFRYQELTEAGVPRFPTYVGVRADAEPKPPTLQGAVPMPDTSPTATAPTSAVRRFEFSEGRSHKFWEIWAAGAEVTVHFGRLGSSGQTQVKAYPDAGAAARHIARMIDEKVRKGYVPAG